MCFQCFVNIQSSLHPLTNRLRCQRLDQLCYSGRGQTMLFFRVKLTGLWCVCGLCRNCRRRRGRYSNAPVAYD